MTQIKPKPLKTCLRYPGGKSRTLKVLSEFIPDGIKEFRDPFLGGGSVPLMFSQNCPETPVWVNDKYWVLYNFWVTLRDRGEELSESLSKFIPDTGDIEGHRVQFYECKEMLSDDSVSNFDKAKAFYVVNKTSYSGLTEMSTFSPGTVNRGSSNNLTQRGIAKLKEFSKVIQNWKITNDDYGECMLSEGSDTFVFLDPPYDIKSFLYGGENGDLHASFSHMEFANRVDECSHRFMITYNINDWIVERYSKYQQTKFNIRYSMNHKEGDGNLKEELLIHNYNLPN